MAHQNKNSDKEGRQLDELEKFLLTHRSKLQKEEQKSIDKEFDASFSLEKNFLAIQQKLKKEKSHRLEAKSIVEEKAKKLFHIEEEKETQNWIKPAPISSEIAKSVKLGSKDIQREVNNWVKPSPVSYSPSNLKTQNSEDKPAVKTVSLRKFWTVAASLTALLVATLGYHLDTVSVLSHENEQLISMYEGEGNKSWEEEHQNVVQTVALPAELVEAENYYTSIIAKEKRELKKKDTQNWVTPETIQTLDELDEAYKVMKNDLLEEQNPKILIDEMLENLKLRKQILDESIQILERTNSETNQNNKTNEKSI